MRSHWQLRNRPWRTKQFGSRDLRLEEAENRSATNSLHGTAIKSSEKAQQQFRANAGFGVDGNGAQLHRRFAKGSLMTMAYTRSTNLDNGSEPLTFHSNLSPTIIPTIFGGGRMIRYQGQLIF